jgi:hypothetical protein
MGVRGRRAALVIGAVALVLGGLVWGAFQPWTANHFMYALPGDDGLPSYIFEQGRRYHAVQVCAGADWCEQDRLQLGPPRCWRQSDLPRLSAWPLVKVGTMFTLFGAPRDIMSMAVRYLTTPYVIADGPDCYVLYGLEGGP